MTVKRRNNIEKITRENKFNGDIVEMTPHEFVDLLNGRWANFKPMLLDTIKKYQVFEFYGFEFTIPNMETMSEVLKLANA